MVTQSVQGSLIGFLMFPPKNGDFFLKMHIFYKTINKIYENWDHNIGPRTISSVKQVSETLTQSQLHSLYIEVTQPGLPDFSIFVTKSDNIYTQ
jgi:hypothetical protein